VPTAATASYSHRLGARISGRASWAVDAFESPSSSIRVLEPNVYTKQSMPHAVGMRVPTAVPLTRAKQVSGGGQSQANAHDEARPKAVPTRASCCIFDVVLGGGREPTRHELRVLLRPGNGTTPVHKTCDKRRRQADPLL
jgi:hypothetical protein